MIPNHAHLLLRTGSVSIALVMRRLLTGYAVSFNRRHERHGHLFQNRYKSILCQEDPYLKELARYIHLNPLRAGLVDDLTALDDYAYSGHSVLMGKKKHVWQDSGYILSLFGSKPSVARRRYRQYVQEGVAKGRRPELMGGGLLRSSGEWARAKGQQSLKGDERILGESDFVVKVLQDADEQLNRRYQLKTRGYDLKRLLQSVASVMEVMPKQITILGKYPKVVEARSLLCYWAVRELGISATELAKEFGLSQPAVSISVRRGEKLARERGLELPE